MHASQNSFEYSICEIMYVKFIDLGSINGALVVAVIFLMVMIFIRCISSGGTEGLPETSLLPAAPVNLGHSET